MTLRCSVVVPTFHRPELLARCLAALSQQTLPAEDYEVIVVDDGASGATHRQTEMAAAAAACDIRYRTVLVMHGPAAARNVGWRTARGKIIAFTDDDCVPAANWLEEGCRAVETTGAAAASGRVIMPLPESPTDYERDASGLTRAEFVTANCFCRRSVLEEIGGFDERFAAAWREDSDLQFTLLERGHAIVRADEAVVVHPLRPGVWGISLKQQRKTQYDALLRAKHPKLCRERIPPFPRNYYAIAAALSAGMVGLASWPVLSLAGFAAWLGLTSQFCAKRLAGTSHRPAHVAEMIVTSALIPPLSLYWHWRGMGRFWNITRQGRRFAGNKESKHGPSPLFAARTGGTVQPEMPDVLNPVSAGWPTPGTAGVYGLEPVLPDSRSVSST